MPIPTRGTNSEKIEPMRRNAIAAHRFCPFVERRVAFYRDILDLAARLTYYMVMVVCVTVKSIGPASRPENPNQPSFGEKRKIAVHRTETQIGKFCLELLMNPGCRGVGRSRR